MDLLQIGCIGVEPTIARQTIKQPISRQGGLAAPPWLFSALIAKSRVEQEGGGWQFHSSDYTCPTSHGARSLHHSVGEQGGGRYRKDFFVQLRDCPTSSLKCGGAKSLPLGGIIPPSPRQSFISILAKLCHAGDPFISAQTPSTHSTQF